jgi:hypothetical protein
VAGAAVIAAQAVVAIRRGVSAAMLRVLSGAVSGMQCVYVRAQVRCGTGVGHRMPTERHRHCGDRLQRQPEHDEQGDEGP